MARNNNKMTRRKKIEPSALTMLFGVPVTTAPGSSTIDLSQCASLVNRRFYRQGINWTVAGFKFLSATGITGELSISKLPTTWVMSNAWEKSFRAWQKMNKQAMEETESIQPKFLDFKIYMDNIHHEAGFDGNLLPTATVTQFTPGEWESSKFVFPSSPTSNSVISVEAIATGASFPGASPVTTLDAVSLIEGYASSRALPEIADPNTPRDADDVGPTGTPENWLGSLFTEGSNQDGVVLNDLQTENNIAPYPFENDGVNVDTMYPNGANQGRGLQMHDFDNITGTTIGGVTYMKGGNFPCGLIRIDSTNFSESSNVLLLVELVPGDHRGYHCEPMTDM